MKTGYIHEGAMENSLFTVCLKERQQSKSGFPFPAHPGSHRKLGPDGVALSTLHLPALPWRVVPSTYRQQEIFSSLKPFLRLFSEFIQAYNFQSYNFQP